MIPIIATSCGGDSTKESGGDKENSQNENIQGNDTDDSEPTEYEINPKDQYDPNFAPVDMGGYVFTVATRDDDAPYHLYPAHTRDIYAEALNGDLINDVVYYRNMAAEEKFNCKIAMKDFPESDEKAGNKIVEKNAKAGEYSFDLLTSHMMYGLQTAANGVLQDIAKFPNIDITKPYWNRGANEGCSIGNRLYVGLSDFSFSSNENLYCIFFNKKLAQDYDIEDPYKLVFDNKWTFDKFNELLRNGYEDLNGNGRKDKNDQFGYMSSNSVNFLWAGGGHIAKKNENDIPYLDFVSERTIEIYEKTLAITNNDYTFTVDQWHLEPSIEIFQDGRALFFSNQLCRVNNLRSVEFEFGIVPYPKLNSNQERYYSYVDGHSSMMCIPVNLPNPEWTGMIIEELSFLSYRDILPTYYDVVLNVKMVRDEESVEMLKILFDSKVYDPAYVMSLPFWVTWIGNISGKKAEIVSTFEKQENSLTKEMDKIINTILELE